MKILYVVSLIIWLYLLTVFTRAKLHFMKFMIGSAGFFFFVIVVIEPFVVEPLGNAVAAIASVPGSMLGIFKALPQYSLIFIERSTSYISFYIDYECSGIIEMLAFVSLVVFFPLFSISEKIAISIGGCCWIFLANVIRIVVICVIIYYGGNSVFYFAHTIFGRIVFYGFSVVMYFYVFTKMHVLRQEVGSFSYGDSN